MFSRSSQTSFFRTDRPLAQVVLVCMYDTESTMEAMAITENLVYCGGNVCCLWLQIVAGYPCLCIKSASTLRLWHPQSYCSGCHIVSTQSPLTVAVHLNFIELTSLRSNILCQSAGSEAPKESRTTEKWSLDFQYVP